MKKKLLVIIRGISGSGKTTYAKNKYPTAPICEADQYFMDKRGNYNFNPRLLKEAHQSCQLKCSSLMEEETETIIVSNTSLQKREVFPYLEMAKKFNYEIKIIRLVVDPEVAYTRNLHKVPLEGILRMDARIENLENEVLVDPHKNQED